MHTARHSALCITKQKKKKCSNYAHRLPKWLICVCDGITNRFRSDFVVETSAISYPNTEL